MSAARRRAGLVGGGALVALLLVEAGARLATGHPLFELRGPESDDYVVVDPTVGRYPKAGLAIDMPEGFSIRTAEHGTRPNGNPPPRAERPLTLVVGDSFAFGDDVDDDASWPAALERQSAGRVVNAGVPGFGLDQAILRAEQLAPLYAPDVIVVGVIPHDVLRCGLSFWSGHPKPYFALDGDGLRFHPAAAAPRPWWAPLKWLLSHSVALDLLFPTLFHWEGPEAVPAHDDAAAVACRLMPRLATLAGQGARVALVVHPQVPESTDEQRRLASDLLGCARAAGVQAVDLFPAFDQLTAAEREKMFDGHLTPAGNELVAQGVAAALSP
jgi:hypothetical protein